MLFSPHTKKNNQTSMPTQAFIPQINRTSTHTHAKTPRTAPLQPSATILIEGFSDSQFIPSSSSSFSPSQNNVSFRRPSRFGTAWDAHRLVRYRHRFAKCRLPAGTGSVVVVVVVVVLLLPMGTEPADECFARSCVARVFCAVSIRIRCFYCAFLPHRGNRVNGGIYLRASELLNITLIERLF